MNETGTNKFGGRGFMIASLDRVAFSIERPERVSEQVMRIVELLDLAEAFPVVSKGSLGSFSRLMTTEEARKRSAKLDGFEGARDPLLRRVDATVVVNVHFPLVERSDRE